MTERRSPLQAAGAHPLVRVAILAAIYLAAGRLALTLAGHTGFAVAIWPAAGVAVAGLLLYGYALWPGVFLGALLVTITAAFEGTGTPAPWTSLGVPLLVASGAAAQAVLAAFLVRRLAGFPSRLDRPGNLLFAMVLAGPVSCLVGAAVAVAALELTGRVLSETIWQAGFTWWLGASIGTVLILPVASEWRREMTGATWRARLRVGGPILLACLVTVVGFLNVRASEAERTEQEFRRRAETLVRALDTSLKSKFEVVSVLAGVVATHDRVTRDHFQALTRDVLERHTDLHAIGLNRVVPYDGIPALEAQARADGYEGFHVRERGSDGSPVPATRRASPHVVVYHIEPRKGNESAHGYDIASDGDRRRALDAAATSSRRLGITAPVRLVQDESDQAGFLLCAPVFQEGRAAEPGAQPDSYVVAVFRASVLIAGSLERAAGEHIAYSVNDPMSGERRPALLAGVEDPAPERPGAYALRWSTVLEVPGRTWTLSFWPTAAYRASTLWGRAWLALAGGLLCTCLLAVYLLVMEGRRAATARGNAALRLRIEERRRAEAALGASEHQYRTLVKNLPGAVYRCTADEDWAVQFASDELANITGYPVEKFYGADGWTYSDLVHPEDLAYVRRVVRDALDTGGSFDCEYRIVRADGDVRWVHERGAALVGADGTPRWLDGVIVDVTQRRIAEEALRESEAMLAEAQRVGHMGSWEYDVEGDRLLWSEEMYRLLDLDRAEAVPGFAAFLDRVHPDDRDLVAAHFEAAVERDEPYEIEYRVIRREGQILHLHSAAELQYDGQGAALRLVGTLQDITRRVELDAEQSRLEARMQEAQKLESLGVLAGGIAHDFNNILTSILGHADLALEDLPRGSPLHDRVRSIGVATRRAADLCQQMLAYAGQGQFVLEELQLCDVVRDMSQMLRIALTEGAELRYELADDLPAVRGDTAQLRQVVLNLVTNASEALDKEGGTVTLSTGLLECDRECLDACHAAHLEPGAYAYIEVSDTGCGMDDDTLDRLFEPFFTTKFTGRGLGMAALLGIVRGHGGGVHVDSTVGEGTTVQVFFPVSAVEEPVREACCTECAKGPEAGTVLLVDDDDSVREIAGFMLESLGCQVLAAEDGESAVDLFRTEHERVAVVLLDLTMPGMGGKAAFEEMLRIDPSARVVICTGYGGPAVEAELAGLPTVGFLQKPFRLQALRNVLSGVLPQVV